MNTGMIVTAIFLFWGASEIVLARMKHSRSTDVPHDKHSLRILWITIALAVILGVLLGLQPIGRVGGEPRLFALIGLVFVVVGLLVRWVAILSLRRQFTVDVAIVAGHHIVKTGIYRFVRHPAYAGSLLSFLGLGVYFSNYLSVIVIFVPVSLAFLYRVRVEEATLTSMFGKEYVEYRSSTSRFIPGVF